MKKANKSVPAGTGKFYSLLFYKIQYYSLLYFYDLIAISFYGIVSLLLCLAILLAAVIFSFFSPNTEKTIAYECGYKPFDYALYPFDIHFYRIGIVFLLFDVEIIFLFP